MPWGVAGLQEIQMLSGHNRAERGPDKLPLSSWAIPILTCLIVLLAVVAALA
jgi:hypothetical protein